MGNAAINDTDCNCIMEFSAKIRATGKTINITAQNILILRPGSSPVASLLYEYEETTMVRASNVVA